MSCFMLFLVLVVKLFNLYICSISVSSLTTTASATTFRTQGHDVGLAADGPQHEAQVLFVSAPSTTTAMIASSITSRFIDGVSAMGSIDQGNSISFDASTIFSGNKKIEDLASKLKQLTGNGLMVNSYNTIDNSHQGPQSALKSSLSSSMEPQHQQSENPNMSSYQTIMNPAITLDKHLQSNSVDGLEDAEMFTNNHHSQGSSSSNSRHYNTYQMSSGTGNNQIIGLYNNAPAKYASGGLNTHRHPSHNHNYQPHPHHHPSSSSTHNFANNFNLNYIHNLLMKPQSTSQVTSNQQQQQASGSISGTTTTTNNNNGLTLSSSSPYGIPFQQNGFASTYISASSALSSALTNLNQQTSTQQKAQQQLSPVIGATTELDDQHEQQNLTVSDLPGASNCGRQQVNAREPRIVGGNKTYEGEFPWAVSIQRHGNHHCGGVIVGRRWILTAAHCVRSQLVANLVVRTGCHTLTRSSNSLTSHLERDYLVEQIIMHDDFSRYDNLTASQMKSSANTNNADIALLKLKYDIHLNEFAWPVCFPNREAGNFSGHDAVVIGWGKLNEKSDDFSNELQKVKLTIIDNKLCQNWFRQAGRDMPIDDRIICAGFKNGGKDACHGDSGGPLLSRINGQYVVVGVVSTGIGCARPLLPGLYSRVSSYISWLERHIVTSQ